MPIVIPTGGSGSVSGTGVTTYAGLVTSVQNWLNRPDLDTLVPDFVDLLEAKLNRTLRVPEMEETVDLTADPTGDLPVDFLELRSLRITDGRELECTSFQTLHDSYEDSTGCPSVFAVSAGLIHLGPAPADETDLTLNYYQTIPALSSDNQTNWLIVSHPDIYLFGTLVMAEAYIWDDPRIGLWKAALEEALDELRTQGRRMRSGGALIPRVRGVA